MTFLFSSDVAPPVIEPDAVRQHYAAQIEAAVTRQLYRGSRLPTLLMLLGSLSCGGLLWGERDHGLLAGLLAWLSLLTGLRLWQCAAFLRAPAERQAAPIWRQTFLLGAAASGITLALVGVLFVPLAAPLLQALICGLLVAAIISASVVYAASLRAFFAFAVPGLLPFSLYLLGHDAAALQGWGVFGLILLAALLVSAWQINRGVRSNLLQRFQNQSLQDFQEQARRAAVRLNRELASEVHQRQAVEAELRAAQRALEQRVSEGSQALSASERARREEEAQRLYLTHYDALTGLANRGLLLERLDAVARRRGAPGQELAMLHLDLDRFNRVGASLGQHLADAILVELAQRLVRSVPQADTIARIAVDEFVILLDSSTGADELESLARRLLAELRQGVTVDGHEVVVSASLGIARLSAAADATALFGQASVAMRHAKQLGGNNVQFYRDSLQASSRERLLLEAQLDKALDKGQLEVFYQPKLTLSSDRLLGVEALVRWRHPQFGLVSPASFIGLAEETGQIRGIGEFVLRQACAQAHAWQSGGLAEVRVSVNIAMQQLRQGDFVAQVAAVLAETGLPAALLELELTESQLSDNVEDVAEVFRQLRGLGVRLAIDDFGTGYSSLGYLKHLPVDVVKIDQTFIRELGSSETGGDAAITRAIIVMAHSLGLEVVAEGVEEVAQLDFLRAHGCDEIQGYLFSRPVEAQAMTELLRARAA
ncbi:bifunctional diguanylate cyclase/phosphodiesterase [Pseudomonas sp. MAP12]|uniref:Bifunctional diguanylate cyclase/phosphodiesterase n=1 Tax=Geopseudomonas aromaticivorans TaxID=2849492 RepID=A0ABS6MYB9_9GAMM|nr:bifunctional diguanylate cyclase/phosphodiesterase [Pseudomonas aromaticivorans]MBV2133232.1 bifunctional diguanylate cyclase/phosphodiesterase [Pseudomonas aromaticivorans]